MVSILNRHADVKIQHALSETPPWTWLLLGGLAVLTTVDFVRRFGLAGDSIVLGSLPNLVAVPVLTFGFLMMRYPSRAQAGRVANALTGTTVVIGLVVLVWEVLQLSGNLVFDPNDIVATGLGAALTLACRPLIHKET